jgi:hypothetical protein
MEYPPLGRELIFLPDPLDMDERTLPFAIEQMLQG